MTSSECGCIDVKRVLTPRPSLASTRKRGRAEKKSLSDSSTCHLKRGLSVTAKCPTALTNRSRSSVVDSRAPSPIHHAERERRKFRAQLRWRFNEPAFASANLLRRFISMQSELHSRAPRWGRSDPLSQLWGNPFLRVCSIRGSGSCWIVLHLTDER